MITQNTVGQLLEVLRLFQQGFAAGHAIKSAYNDAVKTVANRHSVTYQTIGDGCRRRLKLKNIDELYDLLSKWAHGDPSLLANLLKACSDSTAHHLIDEFFRGYPSRTITKEKVTFEPRHFEKSEVFSFRLDEKQARMVRALAGWSGVPAPELVRQIVLETIESRIRSFARELGKDVG